MKYAIYIMAFAIGSVFNTASAQQEGVSINSSGTAADSSAMLDVGSTHPELLIEEKQALKMIKQF